MEIVEEGVAVLPAHSAQVQEAEAVQSPSVKARPTSQVPGALTKRNRKVSNDMSPEWNKFAREYHPRKPAIEISAYSREEAVRRRQREKDRREMQDRNAKLLNLRAEEEAARRQEEKERALAERKAWAQAKFEQRQQKLMRAAEERQKREMAYCQLLQKTRETGLLFEKLQARGEEMVAAHERQKVEEYKAVLAPAKKIGARDIQYADDLHPSLRALQRVQQQTNIRREAQKMPLAFSPKHVTSGPGGTSPFSSYIGERRMPGAGSTRHDSARDPSPQIAKPVNRMRCPSAVRNRALAVDRASSPVALPGVEIIVHKLPASHQADDLGEDVNARQNHIIPDSEADDAQALPGGDAAHPSATPPQQPSATPPEEPFASPVEVLPHDKTEETSHDDRTADTDESEMQAGETVEEEDFGAARNVALDTSGAEEHDDGHDGGGPQPDNSTQGEDVGEEMGPEGDKGQQQES